MLIVVVGSGQKHVEVVAQNGGIPIMLDIDNKQVLLAAENIEQKYNEYYIKRLDIYNQNQNVISNDSKTTRSGDLDFINKF